jgi:hypothetical protein
MKRKLYNVGVSSLNENQQTHGNIIRGTMSSMFGGGRHVQAYVLCVCGNNNETN